MQNSPQNTCARISFLIKLQAQVFYCEFCEIFKNTFFAEHFWTTAPTIDHRIYGTNSSFRVKWNTSGKVWDFWDFFGSINKIQILNTSAVNQAVFCYYWKFAKIIIEKKTLELAVASNAEMHFFKLT